MCEKTKTVNRKELEQVLLDYNRCTPVTITSTTEVKMNKTKKFILDDDSNYTYDEDGKPLSEKVDNPYLGAVVTKSTNGIINFDYQNAVNRQLVREGKTAEFEAKERKWGKHVTKAIIEHKGNYYIQIRVGQTYGHKYMLEGAEIAYNDLKAFITPKKENDHQGTDKEIVIRDIKFDDSVESITLDKTQYIVK